MIAGATVLYFDLS